MDEVEKLKTANANLEQRKDELVKELEQVTIFTEHDLSRVQHVLVSQRAREELVINLCMYCVLK